MAPSIGLLNIDYNNLDANNIKHIVKTLRFVQKEFLFFLCNIESNLIYSLKKKLESFEFRKLFYRDSKSNEDMVYIKFSDTINKYNEVFDGVYKDIIIARNMFCHGRILNADDKMYEYKDIVPIVANFYYKIFKNTYYFVDKRSNNLNRKSGIIFFRLKYSHL